MNHQQRTGAFLLAALASGAALADHHAEGHTVSGTASFEGTGTLYMELVDEAQFAAGENSPLGIAVVIGEAEAAAGGVAFRFEGVPAGSYVLQGFQDMDGDGELGAGAFGPTEPWAIMNYKPSVFAGPDFAKASFEVADDVSDLSVTMAK
ncbi:MAG TPA: DUF2141 domain-containing protein [Pseudomonadales bacterium]|nr:DUF2141 domain-containing protein [Pseudomonadales bacterium]